MYHARPSVPGAWCRQCSSRCPHGGMASSLEGPPLSGQLPARSASLPFDSSRSRARRWAARARQGAQEPRLWPRLTFCSRWTRAPGTSVAAAGIRLRVGGMLPARTQASTDLDTACSQAEQPWKCLGGRNRPALRLQSRTVRVVGGFGGCQGAGTLPTGDFCTEPPCPHPPQVARAKIRPVLRHYGPGGSTMGSPRSGFGTAARRGRSRPIQPR